MKIPFNIKYRPQIESGEYKIVTRDGTLTRIICWDCKNNSYPILGLIDYSDKEVCESFTICGKNNDDIEVGDLDLFIITPDPEIKKFDDILMDCLVETINISEKNMSYQNIIEKYKDQLLAAANAELNTQIELAYKNSDVVQYQRGYEKGYDDAIAKWKGLMEDILKSINHDKI